MLGKINQFFKKYPWVPNIIISLIGIFFSIAILWFNTNFKDIANELIESLREIRENTSVLSSNLKENLNGGMTVIVGVNPKEIKENIAYVYENNDINLKPGDVIYLKNYTDNTFQAQLRFIIQKSLPIDQNKKSTASIFISDEAAKRIGFSEYKARGTIMLKMTRVTQSK